jgi:AraC family transcriptional regulator
LREYGNVKLKPSESPSGLSRERLQQAFDYIQDRLSAELTVSGIAKVVGMSVYHFIRLFRESTGKSPYQYVIDARVRKAKELLATRKSTIAEVAYEVGFVDQSHLTRHFKRAFGITPSTFVSLSCRTYSFYGRNR